MKNLLVKLSLFSTLLCFLLPLAGLFAIDDHALQLQIAESQKAVDSWLQLVDRGEYGKSWESGAKTFQLTISQKEWVSAMERLRAPLGKNNDRQILDIRWAENPKNLPRGDYMVFVYSSSFQQRDQARELLTLQQGSDQVWRVLTYAIQ